MKIIDKEYKEEYKKMGYSKEEVVQIFCPTNKAILGDMFCRQDVNKECCLAYWNREVV